MDAPHYQTMLSPVPGLEFYADIHRYRYQGEWIRNSVSKIAQPVTLEMRQRFDETRHVWEPRGNHVHTAGEAILLGLEPVEGEYKAWVDALRDCWLLRGAETMAVELGIVIPHHDVAGMFDGLIRDADGHVVLLDFKTVQTERAVETRKAATAQLGGYLHGLNLNHPSVVVDKCCTLVVGPGTTKVISEEPDKCFAAWEGCLMTHKAKTQLPF
jgi:hypothetical protein